MNTQAIGILFLKDLYLSRRPLFGYMAAALVSTLVSVVPQPTLAFAGFILILTVAIGSGMHLMGDLLLSEGSDQTRTFILSLPISLLDYSVAKIAVVITSFLIPWATMLACSIIFASFLPWEKAGAVPVLVIVFLELLAAYSLQLVTAVVSESTGWTIGVMVACNVFLNLFLMTLFQNAEISAAMKESSISVSPLILRIIGIEVAIIVAALAVAVVMQLRKRDLV